MIVFACQQCGKRFGRPEATAGSVLFCECGTRNTVPWESTLPIEEMPAEPAPAPPPQLPSPRPSLSPWRSLRQRDPSYCFNHQDTPPQYTCGDCGERFCSDCVVVVRERPLCGPCKNQFVRNLHRKPHVSPLAILAPILSLVAGPFSILMLFGIAGAAVAGQSATAGSIVIVVAVVALVVQGAALFMGNLALRQQEADARISGRSLAITGMVSATACGVLVAEIAVLCLFMVH